MLVFFFQILKKKNSDEGKYWIFTNILFVKTRILIIVIDKCEICPKY
jgi:hypothetical protein